MSLDFLHQLQQHQPQQQQVFLPQQPLQQQAKILNHEMSSHNLNKLPSRQFDNIQSPENLSASTNCESDNDSLKSSPLGQCNHSGFKEVKKQQEAQNYKTEICRNWKIHGSCQYGKKCKYAHGEHELHNKQGVSEFYKTRECKLFHQDGYCSYGIRCHFIHVNKNLSDVKKESRVKFWDIMEHGIVPQKKESRFGFACQAQQSENFLQDLQSLNDFCSAPLI